MIAPYITYILACLILLAPANQSKKDPLIDPAHLFWKTEAPTIFTVRITSTKGEFILEVHKDWAPIGAKRFFNLVRAGFFDDSRFYRVRPGAFAQFGIPGRPVIGKVWQQESIIDDAVLQKNIRGTFAYAMTGPNTRTTQVYINIKDNPQQDEQGFAPLGRVISGMEVVDALYSGYGDTSGGGMRGGKQGRLFEEGNAYLDKEFPTLDKLLKAEIIKK